MLELSPNQIPEHLRKYFRPKYSGKPLIRRNTIIWLKRNAMPSSVKDRFSNDFEHIYFFTKQGRYWFKQQKEPVQQSSINRNKYNWNSTQRTKDPRETRGIDNREAGKLFNEEGRNRRCVWKPTREEYLELCQQWYDENYGDVWDVPTKSFKGSHFAVFPVSLITPMMNAGCPPDGWVLDPFAGSGTVGVVAKQQNKNFIGIELNPEYVKMAEARIEAERERSSSSIEV